MNLIEFQSYFIVVLVSKLVPLYEKKEKKWFEKNASHTISIYEKILIIELSCNFLYLWNCMKSV